MLQFPMGIDHPVYTVSRYELLQQTEKDTNLEPLQKNKVKWVEPLS